MRIFLSGGGHRGSLGAIGAIGYLLWSDAEDVVTKLPGGTRSDRWSDVDEVISVSGGSMLNATLATLPGSDVNETIALLAGFRDRFLHDRLLPWKSVRRLGATLALATLIVAAIGVLASAFGWWGPAAMARAPLAPLAGLFTIPVVVVLARRTVTWYVVDSARVITAAHSHRPKPGDAPLSRRHVISASGLTSGVPYYFVSGGPPLEVSWGVVLGSGYSAADAAVASCSLPGLGQVRAPEAFRREHLVDGGVSGVFGEQIDDPLARRPEDTWRSGRDVFAVDAARHLSSDSRLARVVREVSLSALLARWLKVSLEATYVNDLNDLEATQCARLCVPTASSGAGPLELRLDELRAEVSRLGLTSLSAHAVSTAIVVGLIATMQTRIGLDDDRVAGALAWFGRELNMGDELLGIWKTDAA